MMALMASDYLSLIDPDNPNSFLVAADWLEEQERFEEAVAVRSPPNPPDDFVDSHLYGYGVGQGVNYSFGKGYMHQCGDSYEYGFGYGTGEWYDQGYKKENRYLPYFRVFIEVEPVITPSTKVDGFFR